MLFMEALIFLSWIFQTATMFEFVFLIIHVMFYFRVTIQSSSWPALLASMEVSRTRHNVATSYRVAVLQKYNHHSKTQRVSHSERNIFKFKEKNF